MGADGALAARHQPPPLQGWARQIKPGGGRPTCLLARKGSTGLATQHAACDHTQPHQRQRGALGLGHGGRDGEARHRGGGRAPDAVGGPGHKAQHITAVQHQRGHMARLAVPAVVLAELREHALEAVAEGIARGAVLVGAAVGAVEGHGDIAVQRDAVQHVRGDQVGEGLEVGRGQRERAAGQGDGGAAVAAVGHAGGPLVGGIGAGEGGLGAAHHAGHGDQSSSARSEGAEVHGVLLRYQLAMIWFTNAEPPRSASVKVNTNHWLGLFLPLGLLGRKSLSLATYSVCLVTPFTTMSAPKAMPSSLAGMLASVTPAALSLARMSRNRLLAGALASRAASPLRLLTSCAPARSTLYRRLTVALESSPSPLPSRW